MKKFIRILFSIVLLIAVVAAIAFACLVIFVDPNQLKPMIAEEVMKGTGYQLKIDGNLAWSFYPRLGVKIEHMTLSEPNQAPFADLYDVTIASEMKQLLKGPQKLQGEVYIGSMKLFKLQLKQAYVGLHWLQGMLTLEPLTAKLYDGTLKGVAHGRNLSSDPHWDWSMLASNVQLKPMLQDVNGAESKVVISGVGEVSMTLATHGMAKSQLFSNLNGVSNFSVQSGAVEGIDINYLAQAANAFLNNQSVAAPDHLAKTEFQSLTGTAAIKNGIANINNLMLVSSAFAAAGTGNIDLVQQQLDYKLQITLLHQEKISWGIPVAITGSLHSPTVRIDTDMLKTMVAREQFQKIKSKVAEEVKKLPEKADKLLQQLLR